MQYNYDFHLHYQLVVHVRCSDNFKVFVATGMSTMCVSMGSSILLPAPHLLWGIDY